jgi:hypothetical protein
MAQLAMILPILPGKKEKWLGMLEEILAHGSDSRKDFNETREAVGLHERTYLQETPNGDFMILTLEGDSPQEGWAKLMESLPDGFAEFAMEVHGMDVNAPPPPMPTLVYDSKVS